MLHLGKKTIRAQLLDKEKYSPKGNIEEKKFMLLENVLKTELCTYHLVLKVYFFSQVDTTKKTWIALDLHNKFDKIMLN